MPSATPDRAHTLSDFAGLLSELAEEGFSAVVIGGIAVGAYAQLIGEKSFSLDLDLYTDSTTLGEILSWLRERGITPTKVPQPRSVPVALFSWEGKEVNILTSSLGLPTPDAVRRAARAFSLKDRGSIRVLVADPYDLLGNKLQVHRDKDLPHIEILERFVEEEAVHAFRHEAEPTARLEPARRLLRVTKSRTLPDRLADRLCELAKTPADFRLLMNSVPQSRQADRLLDRAKGDRDLAARLLDIRRHRRFAE